MYFNAAKLANETTAKENLILEKKKRGAADGRASASAGSVASPSSPPSVKAPSSISGDDRESICESSTRGDDSSSLLLSQNQLAAKALEKKILKSLNEQRKREEELTIAIRDQVNIAKARKESGNTIGAVITMKKVKRLQMDLAPVMEAIDIMDGHLMDLKMPLRVEEVLSSLGRVPPSGHLPEDILDESVTKREIESHKSYAWEIYKVLNKKVPDETITFDEAELLKELDDL